MRWAFSRFRGGRLAVTPEVLRSSGWLLSGAVASRGVMLLAWVFTARILVPRDYGKLNLMWTVISFLTGLVGLGLALAVTRQVAEAVVKAPSAAGRYIGATLSLTVASGLAIGVLMAVFQRPLAGALLRSTADGALISTSAAAILFSAVNSSVQGALLGLQDSRAMAAAQSCQGVAGGAGLIGGAVVDGTVGALAGLTFGQAIASLLSFVLLLRATRRRGISVSYGVARRDLSKLWQIAAPTFVGSAVTTIAILGGQIILSRQRHGFGEVAVFNLAYRWYQAILFVPAAIVPLLVPVMTRQYSRASRHEVRTLFGNSLWGMVGLTAVPAVIVAAAAPLLLGASGHYYALNSGPLIILGLAAIPTTVNSVLSNAAVSLGLIRQWLFSDVVLSAALLACAMAFVGDLRATGLALAYLAAFIATDLALAPPLGWRLRSLREST